MSSPCWSTALLLLVANVLAFPQQPTTPSHKTTAGPEVNITDVPEDELTDAKEPSGFTGTCTLTACHAHCNKKQHDTGRCHKEVCVCKDKKRNSRCMTCVASGVGNSMSENINVNNIIMV